MDQQKKYHCASRMDRGERLSRIEVAVHVLRSDRIRATLVRKSPLSGRAGQQPFPDKNILTGTPDQRGARDDRLRTQHEVPREVACSTLRAGNTEGL